MSADFVGAFARLKPLLAKHAKRLSVSKDTSTEYTLVTKSPSPFAQHKGEPLYFGSVRLGKAYVSFHLMSLYMHPTLQKSISPALKKRMQGKTCFNFKTEPESALLDELAQLTEAGLKHFRKMKWL